jgi:hypothetical protein
VIDASVSHGLADEAFQCLRGRGSAPGRGRASPICGEGCLAGLVLGGLVLTRLFLAAHCQVMNPGACPGNTPPSRLAALSPSCCICSCMTAAAKEDEVAHDVVARVAVDVIHVQDSRVVGRFGLALAHYPAVYPVQSTRESGRNRKCCLAASRSGPGRSRTYDQRIMSPLL